MIGGLELRPIVPALILTATGLVALMIQAFAPKGAGGRCAAGATAGVAAALGATLYLHGALPPGVALAGIVTLDAFSSYFHVVILGCGLIVLLLSPAYLRAISCDRGEYYALTLFSMVGMLGLVSARELISLFLALEIMSVSLYALVGFRRERLESQEAAVKYFVTGAFASAFLLLGVAFLYGVSGSTELWRIAQALAAPDSDANAALMATVGAGLLLVGFGFKIASVPFHMWAPDVYQGAPTTVTAFMAAAVKVAAFGALLRILAEALPGVAAQWQGVVAVLALLTMVLGNLGALTQRDLKRMLAWSSVAHAGYLLTALVAPATVAGAAVAFYLVGYAAVSLAGFGTLSALARGGREPCRLEDVAGWGRSRPALAAALTVVLISLTGIPVSAGFVGKFFLFRAAVAGGYAVLAVVGVLMSVVSAYYYLRVVVAMYMRPAEREDDWAAVSGGAGLALAACVAVVLILGIYPGPVLELAEEAAAALR